jgi:hypothetical protein
MDAEGGHTCAATPASAPEALSDESRDFDAELALDDNGPPLLGRWHHGNGILVSGSIRIAQWDCDTSPPTEFRDRVLDWVCENLNEALAAPSTPAEIVVGPGETLAGLPGKPLHVGQVRIAAWPDDVHAKRRAGLGGDPKPVGYLPAHELGRLHSGHDANLRSAKFGPSPLDGDVPVYLAAPSTATLEIAYIDSKPRDERCDYTNAPSTPAATEPDEIYGLKRYLNDVLSAGTANERTVARTALRMIATPPYADLDALDMTRLRNGDCRMLNPENQPVADLLTAARAAS